VGSERTAKDLFVASLDLATAERAAFLERECGPDTALRERVRALLDAHEQTTGFMAAPTAARSPQAVASGREGPGSTVGKYTLLEPIGQGGFGTVFLAEQREPIIRRVALKIIKLGMDTEQVIARFEAERQALAVMDHPHIAKVLDAGATSGGRPFFAMELVTGEPITTFCDRAGLPIRERLALFEQVCAAVQHAHQKGIIHRDIKPSNVLVSKQDGKPFAKVIDFGIAKATSARLTEKEYFTEHGAMIGTPMYMSPEQAAGSADIDTRTDVYSLGVLLYELLTGATPFDPRALRAAGYAEMQRIIREDEPPKPSTRLSQGADSLPSVAAQRGIEPGRLGTLVRGELDWIVMRALEKDRARRYETPSGLAADLRRHLDGEAVLAAPPSTSYRVWKFVKRHRAPVVASAAVLLALLAGLAGTAWQAKVASDERDRAREAEGQTKQRADELQRVSEFQGRMLAQVDPTKAGELLISDMRGKFREALVSAGVPEDERAAQMEAFGGFLRRVNATDTTRDLIDRTILKPALDAIEERFKDQPVVDATLRQVLADRYHDLGLLDAALPLQERALETRRRLLGDEHADTLTSISNTGLLLQHLGRLALAEPYALEALDKYRRVRGEAHPDTLRAVNNMGYILQAQGKLAEAEPYYREALEKFRLVLGSDHPDTVGALTNTGLLLQNLGRLGEAEKLFLEAVGTARRVIGEEAPLTLVTISNVGFILQAQGKLSEAEPFYREALEKRRRVLGEQHPETLVSISNMGGVLQSGGKLDQAEPYCREAIEKCRRVLGEEHPSTLTAINQMGKLLQGQGKLDEAEPYLREAIEKKRRVMGDGHPSTLNSIVQLGLLLQTRGSLDEAEPCFREAMEAYERRLGPEHPSTLITVNSMGYLLLAQGQHAEAAELLGARESAARTTFTGGNTRYLPAWLLNLGRARLGLGQFGAAELPLLEAHRTLIAIRGATPAGLRDCARGCFDLYTAWDAAEPGQGHDVKAAEWKARLGAPDQSGEPGTPGGK